MDEVKQVIVVRKDLNMRKSKLAAQVAHASTKYILDRFKKVIKPYTIETEIWNLTISQSDPLYKWLNNSFTKIIVYVNSEEELFQVKQLAEKEGLHVSLIQDSEVTEFNSVSTYTCIAIGPDFSSKIDQVTKDLPLL